MIADALTAYTGLIETSFSVTIHTFWEHFFMLTASVLTILSLYWQTRYLIETRNEPTQ